MTDHQTGEEFRVLDLGKEATVAGEPLCRISTLVFGQTERSVGEAEIAPAGARPLSDLTRVDSLYAPRPKRGCAAAPGDAGDAVLKLTSTARSSGLAYAYRGNVLPVGRAVKVPERARAFGSFAKAPFAPSTAYVAPDDGGKTLLANLDGTALLANGAPASAEILEHLKER